MQAETQIARGNRACHIICFLITFIQDLAIRSLDDSTLENCEMVVMKRRTTSLFSGFIVSVSKVANLGPVLNEHEQGPIYYSGSKEQGKPPDCTVLD